MPDLSQLSGVDLPSNVSWPTALSIPAGLAGAVRGMRKAPKGNTFEGAVQGAVPMYMAGQGVGAGLQLAEHVPAGWKLPAQLAALLGGGLGGHTMGRLMVGRPSWETKKEIIKSVNQAVEHKLEEHDKAAEATLHEWATENPELAAIPASGMAAATLTNDPRNPTKEKVRAGLTGLLTASGVVGGGVLGKGIAPHSNMAPWAGAGVGGLLSYLAAKRALRSLFGEDEKRAAGPVLVGLQQAKSYSDKRDYYSKHAKLRQLIEKYPSDFYIDSEQGNIVGVTHRPTNFKMHAPRHVLPPGIRRTPQEQLSPKELINVAE